MRVLDSAAYDVIIFVGCALTLVPLGQLIASAVTKPKATLERTATPPEVAFADSVHFGSFNVPQAYWNLGTSPYLTEPAPYSMNLRLAASDGRLYAGHWFYPNSFEESGFGRLYVDYSLASARGDSELVIGLYDITDGTDAVEYTVSSIGDAAYTEGSIRFSYLRCPTGEEWFYSEKLRHKYTLYFEARPSGSKLYGSVTIRRGNHEFYEGPKKQGLFY